MSTKITEPVPITFGRNQWSAITGLPLTAADEMVALGLLRSILIGRRRLFFHADVKKVFDRLATSGEHLQPRRLYEALRAERAAALEPKPKRAART
jgi:hypothetical protein